MDLEQAKRRAEHEINVEVDGAIGHMLAEVTALVDPKGEPVPLPQGVWILKQAIDRASDAITAALDAGRAAGVFHSGAVDAAEDELRVEPGAAQAIRDVGSAVEALRSAIETLMASEGVPTSMWRETEMMLEPIYEQVKIRWRLGLTAYSDAPASR